MKKQEATGLRPVDLSGKETLPVTGELTRVAPAEGSLAVNSEQGCRSKDTRIPEKLLMLARSADNLFWPARSIGLPVQAEQTRSFSAPHLMAQIF